MALRHEAVAVCLRIDCDHKRLFGWRVCAQKVCHALVLLAVAAAADEDHEPRWRRLPDARNGMRHFEQPLNASHLVAATVSAMPDLPTACTANQYRELLSVSRGAGGAGGLVLVLRRELRLAVRSACAAHTMAIACANVPTSKCNLPPAVMACPGVALINAKKADVPVRCVSRPEQLGHAIRVHAARARYGPRLGLVLGKAGVAVDVALELPPVRTMRAVGAGLGDGALARAGMRIVSPVVAVLANLAVAGQGALFLAALGVLIWKGQAVLEAGYLLWGASRGRKLGGGRRRKPWSQRPR